MVFMASQTPATTISPPTPDLAVLHRSVRPIDEVVAELRHLLGARLVAFVAGVKETRAVHEWIDGERSVGNDERERRLRTALQVALLLGQRDDPPVIQAWFQGLNPQLDDHSPAMLLREGNIDEVGREVLRAARAFSAIG